MPESRPLLWRLFSFEFTSSAIIKWPSSSSSAAKVVTASLGFASSFFSSVSFSLLFSASEVLVVTEIGLMGIKPGGDDALFGVAGGRGAQVTSRASLAATGSGGGVGSVSRHDCGGGGGVGAFESCREVNSAAWTSNSTPLDLFQSAVFVLSTIFTLSGCSGSMTGTRSADLRLRFFFLPRRLTADSSTDLIRTLCCDSSALARFEALDGAGVGEGGPLERFTPGATLPLSSLVVEGAVFGRNVDEFGALFTVDGTLLEVDVFVAWLRVILYSRRRGSSYLT